MNYKTVIQLGILSVFLVLSGCAGYYSPNGHDYDYGYDSRSYYYGPASGNYGYSHPGYHADEDFDGVWGRGRP